MSLDASGGVHLQSGLHYEHRSLGTWNCNGWVYPLFVQMKQTLKYEARTPSGFAECCCFSPAPLKPGCLPTTTLPCPLTALSRGTRVTVYPRAASSWHPHTRHCYFQTTTLMVLLNTDTNEMPSLLRPASSDIPSNPLFVPSPTDFRLPVILSLTCWHPTQSSLHLRFSHHAVTHPGSCHYRGPPDPRPSVQTPDSKTSSPPSGFLFNCHHHDRSPIEFSY